MTDFNQKTHDTDVGSHGRKSRQMMEVFENQEFGSIRLLQEAGKTFFCASDVAKALGYVNPYAAVKRHCRGPLTKREGVEDNADTIIGNMDSRVFLGGSEPTTLKELNQALGKETIDLYNTSDTRGNSPSYGTNYQKVGHDLASVDELAVLDGGKCILQLRGVRPFKSDKYDLTQHPNYKLTAGADKKNTFSIEAFLDHRLKLKPGDKYEVVDADHAK